MSTEAPPVCCMSSVLETDISSVLSCVCVART
jgi:hypothetical protein